MYIILGGGGGGGGGGVNFGVILVWVCEPGFFNLHQTYTWSSKKMNDLFTYLIEQNVIIFIYCSLILNTLFAVCKQSLQVIITI